MNRFENELQALRERVDAIDTQLLSLLNARAAVVTDIYTLKERHGAPRFNAVRTDAIIERLVKTNRGPLSPKDVRDLFAHMLEFFVERYRGPGDAEKPGAAEKQ